MSFAFGGGEKKGSSRATTTGTQTASSTSNPWAPTQSYLTQLLGQIGTAGGSLGRVTPGQTAAFGELSANAGRAGQFTPDIEALTRDLFATESTSPMATAAYRRLEGQLMPYATGSVNPMDDPGVAELIRTVGDDAANRVNSMFAGAGRTLSPANSASVSRAVTSATAPILLNQYNTNVARQLGAAETLFGAGQTTAGNVSALDAAANAQRTAGIQTAAAAVESMNLPANIRLQIEQQLKTMPIEELAPMVQYLTTLAGLGGTTSGTQTGTQTTRGTQTQEGSNWGLGFKL